MVSQGGGADTIYQTIPLSIQRDDDIFIVGNIALGDFYQFPEAAIHIMAPMRQGATIAEIRSILGEAAHDIDIDEFVATLLEIGFAHPRGYAPLVSREVLPIEQEWLFFQSSQRLACLLFGRPALMAYVSLVGIAGWCMIRFPVARIDPGSFYIEHGFTATLLLLMALSSMTTGMHELGHLLAAARHGIPSRLSIGNRLWNIVAEADLSGILSLPKRQRYMPLAAGMLVDVVNIAILTIVVSLWARNDDSGFLMQLLHALTLQISVTIVWQFNIFLKTDVYFLLCTWFNHPNLDNDARAYLGSWQHRLTFGRYGAVSERSYRSLAMVRGFTFVWLAGRAMAVATLFGIFVPTMIRYGAKAFHMATTPGESLVSAIDIGLFVLLSSMLIGIGMVLWLRQRSATHFSRS
jgi:hypothetical protein